MKKRLLKVSKNIVNLDFVYRFVYIFRLVTNPFKAKYSSAWLEKVIRHSFFQENNFLPFWNRASKRRSNPNPWSKVRRVFLFVKSNNFVYIFILFCSKVFHVRSVTQGDVIRAEAKDIPRIFQVKANSCLHFVYKFILLTFVWIRCWFYRFCTLVKESLANPRTTLAMIA